MEPLSAHEWGKQLKALRDEDRNRVDKLETRLEEVAKTQVAMQLESKEILALTKNTNSNITNMTGTIFAELKEVKLNQKEVANKHVTHDEIKTLRQLVFGAAGLILVAVVGAWLSQVVKTGGGLP